MDCFSLCYLASVIGAVILLVVGFMDLLKKKEKGEKTEAQIISRQLRGFALIMLSQVVLVLGAMLCFALRRGKKKGGILENIGILGGMPQKGI